MTAHSKRSTQISAHSNPVVGQGGRQRSPGSFFFQPRQTKGPACANQGAVISTSLFARERRTRDHANSIGCSVPFSALVVTVLHSQGLLCGTLGGGAKVWPLDGGLGEPACVHWRHRARRGAAIQPGLLFCSSQQPALGQRRPKHTPSEIARSA